MIDDFPSSFRERLRAHNNKMRGRALGDDGKKLYFVQTEYVKYPFLYVWASSARSAEKYALERPSSEFFDFPERPLKWEVIGDTESVTEEEMKELDLFDKEHPEADQ